VDDEAAALPDSAREMYRACLWRTWSYHWEQYVEEHGPIDGAVVAEQIQKGRGFHGQGRLGGNVLEDVILAQALLRMQQKALDRFEERFQKQAMGTARNTVREVADSPGFWGDLLEHLGGFSREFAARLNTFSGRCGLANWLPRVVHNFTIDQKAQFPSKSLPETLQADDSDALDRLMTADCLPRIAALFQAAVGRLSPEQKMALRLRYLEGVENRDIARVLGVHPGTASRRNEASLLTIRQFLETPEGLTGHEKQMCQECLDHLLGGSGAKDLGRLLWDALFDTDKGRR
jgi:RNA polymerase sigma factor (sigma-70 family)